MGVHVVGVEDAVLWSPVLLPVASAVLQSASHADPKCTADMTAVAT